MSDFTAQLLADDDARMGLVIGLVGVAGTVVGTVLGVLIEFLLRRAGRVRMQVRNAVFVYHTRDSFGGIQETPTPGAEGEFRCDLLIFNGTDTATGIADLKMIARTGLWSSRHLHPISVHDISNRESIDRRSPIGLAPRQWLALHLLFSLRGDDLKTVSNSTRFHLVGVKPSQWRKTVRAGAKASDVQTRARA